MISECDVSVQATSIWYWLTNDAGQHISYIDGMTYIHAHDINSHTIASAIMVYVLTFSTSIETGVFTSFSELW